MSYSFQVQAATKGELLLKVADEFRKIAESQKEHSVDKDAAYAAASGMIDAISESTDRDIRASCWGSISWVGTWPDIKVTQANCTANIELVERS